MLGLYADKCRRSEHPALDFVLGKLHILWSESYIFIYRFFKKLIFGILKAKPDLKAGISESFFILPNVNAVNEHLAAVRLQKPVEMRYQRAFARACVTDNAYKRAFFYLNVNILNCGNLLNRSF